MPIVAQHIRIGQVWKKVGTEETFLVTKLYNEALSTIAVLRPTGAATESMVRVRVERRGEGQILPGLLHGPGKRRATSRGGIALDRAHGQLDHVLHLHHFLHQKRLGIFHPSQVPVVPRDQIDLMVQPVQGDIHF